MHFVRKNYDESAFSPLETFSIFKLNSHCSKIKRLICSLSEFSIFPEKVFRLKKFFSLPKQRMLVKKKIRVPI